MKTVGDIFLSLVGNYTGQKNAFRFKN